MPARLRTWAKGLRRQGRMPRAVQAAAYLYRHLTALPALVFLPKLLLELRRTRGERSARRLVSLAFDGFGGVIRPFQLREELTALVETLERERPERILEIGTANGGTLFALCRTAVDHAQIVSVDLPGARYGGGYPAWKRLLYGRFALPNQRLQLLRADSHVRATYDRVASLLDGKQLDFLFIDGDHTYEGAKQDFEWYKPLVRPGGSIAFHDIVPNPSEPEMGVDRLWQELKSSHEVEEFVRSWDQAGFGIGVLRA